MSMQGSVALILVNWNCSTATLRCTESLRSAAGSRALRIVVVDNGSDDANRQLLLRRTDLDLLDLGVNLGFGAACNLAARKCQESYLLLANPDLEALDNSVEIMAGWLDNHPEAAGAGGHLLDRDGRSQFGFMVRRFPTLTSSTCQALLLDKLPGLGSFLRGYGERRLSLQDPSRVEQPAAACLMLRRPAFESVGGFDERFYPAWFEDVDLCLRFHRANRLLYFLPEARFYHSRGESLSQLSWAEFLGFIYRNQRKYFAKHRGVPGEFVVRCAVVLGMLLRLALLPLVVDSRAGSRRQAALAYANVIRDMLQE